MKERNSESSAVAGKKGEGGEGATLRGYQGMALIGFHMNRTEDSKRVLGREEKKIKRTKQRGKGRGSQPV